MWRRSAVLGLGLLLAAGLLLLLISIITTEPPTEVNTRVLSSDRVNDSQPEHDLDYNNTYDNDGDSYDYKHYNVNNHHHSETHYIYFHNHYFHFHYFNYNNTYDHDNNHHHYTNYTYFHDHDYKNHDYFYDSETDQKKCEKEWLSWKNRCYKWIRVHGSIRFGDYEESEETVRTSCRERSGVAEAQPISIRNSAEMEFLWKQHQKLNSSEPRFVTGLLAPYGTKEEGTDHFEWVDGTPTNDFLADPDNWYGGLPEHSDHFVSIYNGSRSAGSIL
ncbi:hypothetical protein QR680_012223 [Steinernema hermaphroditum]|uniref:C-type lectin domain-containing protein n=1 Tax=Steinernema hermaphroditum TaxID=289476 RepID=A0AA39M0E7_9BILA|nr:hypothetical protein QR680_012223 [Steinernema hermaphroditum]